MRNWIGVALLAASWLAGVEYFAPANLPLWLTCVVLGALLLIGFDRAAAGEPAARCPMLLLGTVALSLPAAWWLPAPYRVVPILLAAGAGVSFLGLRAVRPAHAVSAAETPVAARGARPWPRRLGSALSLAALILLVQAIALWAYVQQTARGHDLPWPLPEGLAAAARLFGAEASAVDATVVVDSPRQVHRLAATWELLLDPASLLFYVGGLMLLARVARGLPVGRRWTAWMGAFRRLTLVVAIWLPLRGGLLMAVYLDRVARYPAEAPLQVMDHFFSPWVLAALLLAPVLLAWRFVRCDQGLATDGDAAAAAPQPTRPAQTARPRHAAWRLARTSAALLFLAAAGAALAVGCFFTPLGPRQAGRVKFVERHSAWEPTAPHYGTTRYGEDSAYNYALIYDYLGQYYQMSRLPREAAINDDALADCDVLIIKTPTERYAPDEAAAVRRFVERRGGLLLIGDHTNLEGSGATMNDICGPMGFVFRPDLLFGVGDSPYDQTFRPAWAPHPAVQHLPPTEFAVSCSIDPGRSAGRAAILSTGLWSMGPAYHHSNYHPVPQHCPEMRCGAFIQLWDTRYGRGRALAFTDSTIFSSFCLMQEGKSELMRDMVEYLNHRPGWDWTPLMFAAAAALALAAWACGAATLGSGLILAALLCGFALGGQAVDALQARQMPPPSPVHPLTQVIVDRETSNVPLARGPYPQGEEAGYGLLEMWIPRLGYFASRRTGAAIFAGDAVVVIGPTQPVTPEYLQRVERFVSEGGALVVIDSPAQTDSTANAILQPFGLSFDRQQAWQGTLALVGDWPDLHVAQAWEVRGGEAVARLGARSVAAMAEHGRGRVLAIGFGSLFNDTNMGVMWMLNPSAEVRTRYQALYALLRLAVENRPLAVPTEAELPEPPAAPRSSLMHTGRGLRGRAALEPGNLPDLPDSLEGPVIEGPVIEGPAIDNRSTRKPDSEQATPEDSPRDEPRP